MFNLKFEKKIFLAVVTVLLLAGISSMGVANALTGSIRTSDSTCTATNQNHFTSKDDVAIKGGPQNLPDGDYYVRVTNTSGKITLGTSIGTSNETPVNVSGGVFSGCYVLVDILKKISDGTPGYDDSSNGVYKVWVSTDADFTDTKTDNFKVGADGGTTHPVSITICKDANPDNEQDFAFTGDLGQFTLDDDTDNTLEDCATFTEPEDVSYEVNETPVNNWDLTLIDCTGASDFSTDVDNNQVTINAKADEVIICTFLNQGKATITINKVSLDGTGIFDFSIYDGTNTIPVSIDTDLGPNPVSTVVDAGIDYSVYENSPLPDWFRYVDVSCVDQDANSVGDPITQGKENIFVNPGDEITCTFTNQGLGRINVYKYYDVNVNGAYDSGLDILISGWKIAVDGISHLTFWDDLYDVGTHLVTEADPVEKNWLHTTVTSYNVDVPFADHIDVKFGNVCFAPGGGHTLGFWSNKNGQAKMSDAPLGVNQELAFLSGLPLSNAVGYVPDFTSYLNFRTWILNANAVNMSYMLSAQLAAMELNVEAGYVPGGSIVYAPGLLPFASIIGPNLSATGFISIDNLMAAANTALGADGYTPASDINRPYQEALKNALDAANNNKNFVSPTPCAFSFAP